MRDIQIHLQLKHRRTYRENWLASQWPSWEQFLSDLRVPAEHLVRSHKAEKARRELGAEAEFSMLEFSASTVAVLALLAK